MDDHDIRQLLNRTSPCNINFELASIAAIITDSLHFDVFTESFVDVLVVLDLQRNVIEGLIPCANTSTVLTHSSVPLLSAIDSIENSGEWSNLQTILQLLKDLSEELLGILLYAHVDRVTTPVFKGMAEAGRVVVLAI